ncbi:hypothetical protein HZC53_06090 [Candidatus Uhrbacteria bacterium]|nr:hypothetical protein [Candidatus Uhrbacteria bacterium]
MENENKAFRRGLYSMVGTVIGAGTFALPAAMQEMGILAGSIAYWAAALVVLATHLLFLELVTHNKSMVKKRFPGYLEEAFGPWAKKLGYLTQAAQVTGASLAYIILGGEFMYDIAGSLGLPFNILAWQILFWVGGAVTVLYGLKIVAKIESWMTILLVLLLLTTLGPYFIQADATLFFESHWLRVMPLIGIFLFSLFGWGVIPEVHSICGNDKNKTRLAVTIGSLAAAFLMWLFGVFAYASLNGALTDEAASLGIGMPVWLFWLIPAVGFLAVATSFITLNQDFKAMLHLDAGLTKPVAWMIALGSPLFLLFVTSRDFVGTVGFVGAGISSLNGILLCGAAFKFMRGDRKVNFLWRVVAPVACALIFTVVVVWNYAII